MSSWLHYDRREGRRSWKQSWTARALSSCSLPPAPLLAFFVIVVFFLAVSGYVDYRAMERRAEIGARVFAAPLILMAAFLAFSALRWRRRYWATMVRRRAVASAPATAPAPAAGAAPWGVALAVALLLVMVSFQSSVHSMWFRPLWDSDYS